MVLAVGDYVILNIYMTEDVSTAVVHYQVESGKWLMLAFSIMCKQYGWWIKLDTSVPVICISKWYTAAFQCATQKLAHTLFNGWEGKCCIFTVAWAL